MEIKKYSTIVLWNARIESIKESNLSMKKSSLAKHDKVLANIADKVEIFICDWLENIDNYEKKSASLNSTWAEKMLENIISLTNKVFFVTTPYRFYPIDFHTKIPFIHMLPKKIHRAILKLLKFGWIDENTLIILEKGKNEIFKSKINLIDKRVYGNTEILFLKF